MVFELVRSLASQFLLGVGLTGIVFGTFAVLYDIGYAQEFLKIAVSDMKGLWVWTLGVGLMVFIMRHGQSFANTVRSLLDDSDTAHESVAQIALATQHRTAIRFTVPITFAGTLLTLVYRVPHTGASYWFLTALVIWIYYVASFLLAHFVGVISAFNKLYKRLDSVRLRVGFNPLSLENATTYLVLTTTIGVFSIYSGFRGTVTAGFDFIHPVWRSFLTTPLVLFLPATLFYNYYPRHVLRKIIQYRVLLAYAAIEESDINARQIAQEVRDATSLNHELLPFIDYKSVPSYLVAAWFFANLVYSQDPAIKAFFDGMLGINAQ